jgi:ankyrin repeat protein
MKRFALIALGTASLLAAPAVGQSYVSDAEPFLSGVQDRDGDKVTSLLDTRPTLVNSRNLKGQIALNVVIARSDDTWLRFLLGRGADPNLAASNGDTPLIAAARVGFTDAIEILLARGAKVNSANRMGETPLIIAVQQRQLPAVKLLLAKGADPDKRDTAAGYSAREYAKRDTRNRELLSAIEAAKTPTKTPAAKPKSDDLDSFKLN